MEKAKKSSSAIAMYIIIAISAFIAAVTLPMYYTNTIKSAVCLWIGVTFFTIMYHLWLRLIMGNITKLFNIKYTMWWYKERKFERHILSFLKVKSWKNKVLTYNPELFSLKKFPLESIANTMSKAETDHLINMVISLSTLLFSLIWGQLWIFALTCVLAILFDLQFVLIQRYNRPRVVRLINKQKLKVK